VWCKTIFAANRQIVALDAEIRLKVWWNQRKVLILQRKSSTGRYMITTLNSTVNKTRHTLSNAISTRERIMASTVSVDEYFDELIEQVHEDYANL